MMNKDEVERWLCAPGNPVPSPATVAGLLGLPVAQVADTTLLRTARHVQSLRFTLALLRDRFDSDRDVRDWLDEPRCDLDGLSPGAGVDVALRQMAATMACHAAVKANDPLTREKMQYLLDELRRTAHSSVCPHGRPVVLRLTRREIEKSFERI